MAEMLAFCPRAFMLLCFVGRGHSGVGLMVAEILREVKLSCGVPLSTGGIS